MHKLVQKQFLTLQNKHWHAQRAPLRLSIQADIYEVGKVKRTTQPKLNAQSNGRLRLRRIIRSIVRAYRRYNAPSVAHPRKL